MKGHFAFLCPECGGWNTEWEPFDQEIYEIYDDISGNISRIDGDLADIRIGRRCRDCGKGYVVDIRVDLDEGTCVYRSDRYHERQEADQGSGIGRAHRADRQHGEEDRQSEEEEREGGEARIQGEAIP